ncbi:MAG: hypothetical protein J5726_04930 [Treponema sp.]|nr:hypothetical protein [Treponema sp.]
MKIFKTALKNSLSFSKKTTLILAYALLFCTALFAQSKYSIDYYGILADGVDDNMSKMTSDLYYTQLCEINNYSITDKREGIKLSSIPDSSKLNTDKLSFYAIITKAEDSSKWISTISIYDGVKKSTYSESKEYDSFYKILMEPKSSLQQTITALLSSTASSSSAQSTSTSTKVVQSTEFLSGTWSGEDSIDKIVIMRGGRGFVIFKNGASMNITVEIKASGSSQSIVITQNGKANASFFTDLPRELALKEAVNADPIRWVLEASDDNTLKGIKSTLILNNGAAKSGTVSVTWKRKS